MAQTTVKQIQKQARRTLATPHIPGLQPSWIDLEKSTRIGALVWWRFQDSYADFTDLAEAATRAGLSPLFAPLPHPVSPAVAFNRMTRAAERVIDDQLWYGVKVRREGRRRRRKIPEDVKRWGRKHTPLPMIAAVQTWEPELAGPEHEEPEPAHLRRPFHVRLWVCLRQDPDKPLAEQLPLPSLHETPAHGRDSRWLPTMEVARLFMVIETDPEKETEKVLDITAHVVNAAKGPPKDAQEEKALVTEVVEILEVEDDPEQLHREALLAIHNLEMGAHLYTVLDRQRTLATSPEIGDGVNEALEDVAGIKLRPGLFAVPGATGIERGEALLAYLAAVPQCDRGMFDLYAANGDRRLAGLIQPVLDRDIKRLEQEIHGLHAQKTGAGALRTLWLRLMAQRWRIGKNEELLGPAAEELDGRPKELARTLEAMAGDVDLGAKPSKTVGRRSQRARKALEYIHAFAKSERVEEESPLVTEALARPMSPLQSLRCKTLLRRLRKLIVATIHVAHDRSHGSEADALARIERLRPVLGSAANYLEEQCR